MPRLHALELLHEPVPHHCGVLHKAAFDQPQRGQGGRAGNRVAAERVAMRARVPGHLSLAGHHRSKRQPGGNALGDGYDLGHDSPVLDSKHLARTPHTRLNLVVHQQDVVLVRQLPQPLVIQLRWHNVATLALNRFDKDRCDLFG